MRPPLRDERRIHGVGRKAPRIRPPRLPLATPAFAVALALAWPAGAPLCADTQQKLVVRGRAESETLWRRGYALGDTALDGLLQRTLDSLTAGVPRPEGVVLRVRVFRSPEINAFALPDGSIFVFAGLLSTFTDFHQVAFVLAHEAQHAIGQHARRHLEQTNSTVAVFEAVSFVTTIALASSGFSSAGLVNEFAQLGLGLSAMAAINGYGRGMERESDLTALQLMSGAGRDPCGAVEAMQALQYFQRKEPGRLSSVFWNNHPLLVDRIRYLLETSKATGCAFDTAAVAGDYAAHKWALAKLSAGMWVAEHEPAKALRVALGYSRIFPEDAGAQVTIGDALAESTRPDTLALAVAAYERALGLAPDDRAPLRGLALVEEKRGDTTACVAYLERYLEGDAPVRDRRSLRRKLETYRPRFGLAPAASNPRGTTPADSTALAPGPGIQRKER